MSDLDWQPFFDDVETLMSGHHDHVGKARARTRFRQFDRLGAIHEHTIKLARAANPSVNWTADDTSRLIVSLLESVKDDEFDRRGLLAVKICAGFRKDPSPNDRVSREDPKLRWSDMEQKNKELYAKRDSFSISINVRRLFAAPLYGGANVNHFDRDSPALKEVTKEFIRALEDAVKAEATAVSDATAASIERVPSAQRAQVSEDEPPTALLPNLHSAHSFVSGNSPPRPEETEERAAQRLRKSAGADVGVPGRQPKSQATSGKLRPESPTWIAPPTQTGDLDRQSEVVGVAQRSKRRELQARRKPGRLAATAVAGVLLVGVAVTVVLLITRSTPPEGSSIEDATTVIRTYVPGDAEATAAAGLSPHDLDATCWERSYVSARKDARLCALGGVDGGFIYDPCFEIGPDTVTCFSDSDIFRSSPPLGVVARITESLPAPSFLPTDGLVGAEQADQTRYPWALKLAFNDPNGSPYLCSPLAVKSPSLEGVPFACGPGEQRLATGQADFAVAKFLDVQLAGTIQATALDTTTNQWTISITDPTTSTLKRVAVVGAWY